MDFGVDDAILWPVFIKLEQAPVCAGYRIVVYRKDGTSARRELKSSFYVAAGKNGDKTISWHKLPCGERTNRSELTRLNC